MKTIGITRVRNEGLIIEDTIRHFLGYCDHIILYDDCSEDGTAELASEVGGCRITIIRGEEWSANRLLEETRHRRLLTNAAMTLGADWVLCFDADERLVVNGIPPLLMSGRSADGYTFRLFDGYLTQRTKDRYLRGDRLDELPRLWGPEYRDILMLFRPTRIRYEGLDRREPICDGLVAEAPGLFVKHFGKCISEEQWEETCRYYSTHFPKRYRTKWAARFGKAIHTTSDFGRMLLTWKQLMRYQQAWVKL